MKDQLHNRPYLKQRRKDLRNNLTPAEATLWKALKGKQLDGVKFRRQHSIGNYIVDFYCPEFELAIELDGSIHNNVVVHNNDVERQENLESLGITVIRFDNADVLNQMDRVLQSIRETINELK